MVALGAWAGESGVTNSAQASTPPLTWQGVSTLQVLCLVDPPTLPTRDALQGRICGEVRRQAASGAPIPVKQLAFGDPALIEPGTATLLVHGNVQNVSGQELLLVHVRLFRPARLEAETFFTAPPVAVPLNISRASGDALGDALALSMARILPWRGGRQGNSQ
jgi:hypothetical protein